MEIRGEEGEEEERRERRRRKGEEEEEEAAPLPVIPASVTGWQLNEEVAHKHQKRRRSENRTCLESWALVQVKVDYDYN